MAWHHYLLVELDCFQLASKELTYCCYSLSPTSVVLKSPRSFVGVPYRLLLIARLSVMRSSQSGVHYSYESIKLTMNAVRKSFYFTRLMLHILSHPSCYDVMMGRPSISRLSFAHRNSLFIVLLRFELSSILCTLIIPVVNLPAFKYDFLDFQR